MDPDTTALLAALRAGDRVALAKAITLIESTRPADRVLAIDLLDRLGPAPNMALRLGITGIPGVGKSTLIDALGRHAIAQGRRVAVLATDPSSQRSGGSILGDKTRMDALSRAEQAFIRPSPTSGLLGGVAPRTRETMLLCEAAGYDLILVETVGVGQSEADVDNMTDLNVLLTIAGAGDDLQGIKRGIMESADAIVVTKTQQLDTKMLTSTLQALQHAIPFLPLRENGRRPEVLRTDALAGTGIAALWAHVLALFERDLGSGRVQARRTEQQVGWMKQAIAEGLQRLLQDTPGMGTILADQTEEVRTGRTGALKAAEAVLQAFRKAGARLP
ncbi:MAG: methylmalonyl Co-A mutase-associated GTPase MeaB [Flavobacteriales bacterium]|nr:methylmalonyl Co-A mutase-associated GTPase MeaB [Flavobacteriales bacterium]